MKYPLFFFALLLSTQPASAQILEQPRVFEFEDIQRELFGLRKATVEHIIVRGDNTPEGDQQVLTTLRKFLAPQIFSTDGVHSWKKFSRAVKRLTIENVNWAQVPGELGEFNHLSELTFVHCPNLNLQTINDQVKALDKRSSLYEKFHEEMISMTFQAATWQVDGGFVLEPELFSDLRELRFIDIANFHDCCASLLPGLQRACPTLGWLTIAGCQLDDRLPLDTLRAFPKLQSLSLRNNRLTRVPALPAKLISLDVSRNLISEFFEKTPDNPLRMLYMNCNLFSRPSMTDMLARNLYPSLDVLTYECNNLSGKDLDATTQLLDRGRVAGFMSYAPRYVNDFRPDPVDCSECLDYRWGMAKSLLENVPFLDKTSGECRLEFGQNRDRIVVRKSGQATTYSFVQINKCERNVGGEWVFTIEVQEAAGLIATPKFLIATLKTDGQPSGTFRMD